MPEDKKEGQGGGATEPGPVPTEPESAPTEPGKPEAA